MPPDPTVFSLDGLALVNTVVRLITVPIPLIGNPVE